MKKLVSSILILGFSLFLFVWNEQLAFADENEIPLGQTISDYFIDEWGVDEANYQFKLSNPGLVTLSFNNTAGEYFDIAILNEKGQVLKKLESDSYGTVSGKVGLPKGTYYVKINTILWTDYIPYEFKVTFKKSSQYEKEYNNTTNTATAISLNKDYYGTIQNYDDIDFYKFTLKADGKITLSMSNVKEGWLVKVLNSKKKVIEEFYTDSESFKGKNPNVNIGLAKGTYYVQIEDVDTVNTQYKLKVSFTKSDAYEKELNNSIQTATLIKLNKTYNGNIHMDDTDIYKFTVPSTGKVKITMSQKPGISWDVYIYDSKKNKKAYFYTDSDAFAKKTVTKTIKLNKGTYYIKIPLNLRSSYSFSVSNKTATPKASNVVIKNNKGKSDTITVKGLKKGSVVKVYNTKSKVIAKGTSKGSSLTLSVKQLGKNAGKVYVTVQEPQFKASSKVTVKYKKE